MTVVLLFQVGIGGQIYEVSGLKSSSPSRHEKLAADWKEVPNKIYDSFPQPRPTHKKNPPPWSIFIELTSKLHQRLQLIYRTNILAS